MHAECDRPKTAINDNERRTHRLNEPFLEQGISVEEYRSMKNALVDAKQKHLHTLAGSLGKSSGWLEPVIEYLYRRSTSELRRRNRIESRNLEKAQRSRLELKPART